MFIIEKKISIGKHAYSHHFFEILYIFIQVIFTNIITY